MKFVFLSLFVLNGLANAAITAHTGCLKLKNVLGMSKDVQFGPIIDIVSVDSAMIYSDIDTTYSDSNGCYSVLYNDNLVANLSVLNPKLNQEYDYFDPKGMIRNKTDVGHLLLQKRAKDPDLEISQKQFLRVNNSSYEIQVKAKGFVDTLMRMPVATNLGGLAHDTLYLRKDPECR